MMSNYNPFSLEGKTILVTGASSGIGQATAIECSKMGAKLVITGRNAERLQHTFDRLAGDGHKQINNITTAIDKRDYYINLGFEGLVIRNFDAEYQFGGKRNNSMLKFKKIVKCGSVVFVASIAGMQGRTSPANAMYGASKAALVATMRYFAREYSTKLIRFNSVNPSMVNTPLIQHGAITEEQRKIDMANYPLGRYGEPIDIAHGIIYLLSDASSWVTGHSLVIDGGVTI